MEFKDKTFKDLTKYSVIRVPEGEEVGEFSEGEYTVYGTSVCKHYGSCVALLKEDDWGEYDPYLENLSEDEFLEANCEIVSIPDDKTQQTIKDLDELIVSLENQATEIKNKSKEAGLEYDVVVLSDVGDLATWHSSRC